MNKSDKKTKGGKNKRKILIHTLLIACLSLYKNGKHFRQIICWIDALWFYQ